MGRGSPARAVERASGLEISPRQERGSPTAAATVHYLPIGSAAAASRLKRVFDVLVALMALLMFLPLLLLIGLAVRLETPGPALFRQRRSGLNGRPFSIYKFRTMRVLEDGAGIRHVTKNDARVTPLGLILRKCSLDELPQLLNVLRGDMAMVGPRPHALSHDEHYGALIPTYSGRFRARPGLTGLAQVQGYRGEVRELRDMCDRVAADNAYIDRWSLAADLRIVAATFPLILGDPNAY